MNVIVIVNIDLFYKYQIYKSNNKNRNLARKETTTHPSSHGEDEACEGGWSGYPSDHQTTLDKLHVGL